ncbi:MAG: hypothetical protein U9P00_07800, partial [Pseudomonadota bacterium]|nr:hypothetical protein [Pseudomonadota bacterium]
DAHRIASVRVSRGGGGEESVPDYAADATDTGEVADTGESGEALLPARQDEPPMMARMAQDVKAEDDAVRHMEELRRRTAGTPSGSGGSEPETERKTGN